MTSDHLMTLNRTLVALLSIAATPAWAQMPCAQADACRYFVRVEGKFEEAPGSNPEGVAAMNNGLSSAVAYAVKTMALRESREETDLEAWRTQAEKLETRGGDRFFLVSVRAGPGLELQTTVRSLHRDELVYGQARMSIPVLPKPQWQFTALKSKLLMGLEQSLEDLTLRINEATGPTIRRMHLAVLVSGLDEDARIYLEKILLPCVRGLFDTPAGSAPQVSVHGGYLEYSFPYLKGADEPRDPLDWRVGRVAEAVGAGNRECPLEESPLSEHQPSVSRDELNQSVRVHFRKR